MNEDQKTKLFDIRCRSKMGKPITKAEIKFFTKMHKLYPIEYEAMSKDVFEETKPFGSNFQNL